MVFYMVFHFFLRSQSDHDQLDFCLQQQQRGVIVEVIVWCQRKDNVKQKVSPNCEVLVHHRTAHVLGC